MKIYGKNEEKLLAYISRQSDTDHGLTWSDMWYAYILTLPDFLVSAEHIFNRGLDLEELALVMTGDAEKAWEIAEPYYDVAKQKGYAKAFYRLAMHWEDSDLPEFKYAYYLEGAAKRRYMPAVRDFVNRYDEIKVQMITRNAWRIKRRQDKVFFQSCKLLSKRDDPNALWELGTCYLLGTGVRQDECKGLIIRDRALELWDLDEESKENLAEVQRIYKLLTVKKGEPLLKYCLRTVRLFLKANMNSLKRVHTNKTTL